MTVETGAGVVEDFTARMMGVVNAGMFSLLLSAFSTSPTAGPLGSRTARPACGTAGSVPVPPPTTEGHPSRNHGLLALGTHPGPNTLTCHCFSPHLWS